MKQDKGTIPMTNGTSIAPSEGRGVGDIDASTDYNMEDALLWVLTPSFSSLMFYRMICCLALMFSLISIVTFTKKGKKSLSYFLCAAECKSWRFAFRFPNQ
jgi:hypothetical protein